MHANYKIALFFTVYILLCSGVKGDEFRDERFISNETDTCVCNSTFISNETDTCVCNSTCEEYSFSANEYAKYCAILTEELKTNVLLKSGWETAKTLKKSDPLLSENEVLAVVTYTLESPKVYGTFNNLTRTHGITSDAFTFKGMHFFLSSAVHKLAIDLPQSTFRCETSPQAGDVVIGNFFSFKQFASTTTDIYTARSFGQSCLHLITLRGASISSLSAYPSEQEILIPSCETFKVSPLDEDESDIVYAKLLSTGKGGNQGNGAGLGITPDFKNVFLFPVLVVSNVLFLV